MHLVFTWFMFEAGQAINIWLKFNSMVVDKTNDSNSRWEMFTKQLPVCVKRVFAVTCLFGVFFTGAAPGLLKVLGMSEDGKTVMILSEFTLVMSTVAAPFFAGIAGLAIDSLASKIPALAIILPKE